MSLRIGTHISVPGLPGRWSVWSQSAESPGAWFILPADDDAKVLDVKYAVVRAVLRRGCADPTLSLLRTDPARRVKT